MKVLLDVSSVSVPLTGIGRYSLELARHLSQQAELQDLFYLAEGHISDQFNTDLHDVAPRRETGALRGLVKRLLPEDLILRPYRKRKDRALERKLLPYSEYIFHSPNFSLPAFRGKSVVTLHDLSVFHFPQYHPVDRVNFLKEQIYASVENADILVTDSEFVRRELIDLFSLDEARVRAVPLGVDPVFSPRASEEIQHRLEQYGLAGKSYLLSVGTVEPRKNLAGLLGAYLQLDKTLRSRHPLVVVGAYGWGDTELVRKMDALSRSGEMIYLRYVDEKDLPYIYAGATTFCYMSFYEGFGLPVLEAMSSGVPVVCSNTSALPELCGLTALQTAPEDEFAIAQALHRSLTDESWRAKAIDTGRTRSEAYRWQTTATHMTDLYANLESRPA